MLALTTVAVVFVCTSRTSEQRDPAAAALFKPYWPTGVRRVPGSWLRAWQAQRRKGRSHEQHATVGEPPPPGRKNLTSFMLNPSSPSTRHPSRSDSTGTLTILHEITFTLHRASPRDRRRLGLGKSTCCRHPRGGHADHGTVKLAVPTCQDR